jgi:hypothetical protein
LEVGTATEVVEMVRWQDASLSANMTVLEAPSRMVLSLPTEIAVPEVGVPKSCQFAAYEAPIQPPFWYRL